MYVLGCAATIASIEAFALQTDKNSDVLLPNSSKSQPKVKYRNPVALWTECTYLGGTEVAEALPAWSAKVTMSCETGDQCLSLLQQLINGMESELQGDLMSLTLLELTNRFSNRDAHPTRVRSCQLHMMFSTEKQGSTPVLIEIEHRDVIKTYESVANYSVAYNYFSDRMVNMSQVAFDAKFEVLLSFLVEAIGVPVLLSLLLLTYTAMDSGDRSTNKDAVISLESLPDTRLQLYKLGIAAGIRNRMRIEMNAHASQGKEKQEKEQAEKQAAAANEDSGARARTKRTSKQI